MDSRSLFLTANCDTVYFMSFIDLTDGPVVLEAPPRTLSVIDDMWFRWVGDVGLSGPDRGEGGRFLLVPAGYRGPLPEGGFFTYRAATNRVVLLGRAFLEDDDPRPAVARIKQGLKITPYEAGGFGLSIGGALAGRGPLGTPEERPSPRFVEGTGLPINTIPPNDVSFFSLLDATVQAEPIEALDPEVAGAFAAIGIVKDQPFRPRRAADQDPGRRRSPGRTRPPAPSPSARAPARGSTTTARRRAGSRRCSSGGYEFQQPPPLVTRAGVVPLADPGARHLHGQAAFFYIATGITPAMCMRLPGVGSQYLAAMTDATGDAFDGARTYHVTLPADIPAGAFWSLTLYDNQTRSLLVTPQRFPRAGSQSYPTPAAQASQDGATTIVIGPDRPPDVPEGNWVQTLPGQGWFVILRFYSPAVPFFDQSWRPGEVELVR